MRPIIFTYKYWVKFSILAWRIPWTEEPGGLQSMQLQRVGHNWTDDTWNFIANYLNRKHYLGCIFMYRKKVLVSQSCLIIWFFVTVGFSRQEYWFGLPCPPPGDLPHPGIQLKSPALQADSLSSELPRKLLYSYIWMPNTLHTNSAF